MLGALATPVVVIALVRRRPPRLWPWPLLLVGMVLAADAVPLARLLGGTGTGPVAVLAVAGYGCVAVAALGLTRTPDEAVDTTLDAVVVAAAVALVGWSAVGRPLAQAVPPAERVELLLDAALLAAVVRITITSLRRQTVGWLLLVGWGGVLAGNLLRTLELAGRVQLSPVADRLPAALTAVAIGAVTGAALHPGVRRTPTRAAVPPDHDPRARGAAVAAALLTPVAVAVPDLPGGANVVAYVLASGAIVTAVALRVTRALASARRNRRRLARQAVTDQLTGLPNRSRLRELLAVRLAANPDPGTGGDGVAVLFLDLDRLQSVNEERGYRGGDELLRAVAGRLVGWAGSSAPDEEPPVARTGGDEFAVLAEAGSDKEADDLGSQLLRAFEAPFPLAGGETTITPSIGVARGPGVAAAAPSDRVDALLRGAEVAAGEAKEAGRATVVRFDDSMRQGLRRRLTIERELRALTTGDPGRQLELHYQPIVELSSGRLAGFEALLRWRHPDLGSVSPAVFVPIAEETGMIVPLGRWCLRRAATQLEEWISGSGPVDLRVSVNVSARQLADPDLAPVVEDASARLGWGRLVIEVTETVAMSGTSDVAQLERLRRLGVRIAADDFGTGHASLAALERHPFDILKIDRAFVAGSGTPRTDALLEAVMTLADAYDLDVVAEGIEEPEQHARLAALGCHYGQGFLFARPLPADEATALLRGHAPPVTPHVTAARGSAARPAHRSG